MYFRTVRGETRTPSFTNNSSQFICNPLFTPKRILRRHPANELPQLQRNRWPTRPTLPAPKDAPAQSMPANDGGRAHHHDRVTPTELPSPTRRGVHSQSARSRPKTKKPCHDQYVSVAQQNQARRRSSTSRNFASPEGEGFQPSPRGTLIGSMPKAAILLALPCAT